MGRKADPLYYRDDGKTKSYYARFYKDGKRCRLSLNCTDKTIAMQRLPVVLSAGVSWDQYTKSVSQFSDRPQVNIYGIAGNSFSPAINNIGTKDGIIALLQMAFNSGVARYNESTQEWIIDNRAVSNNGGLIPDLKRVETILQSSDDFEQITDFWNNAISQIFVKSDTNERFARIWLDWLKDNKIKSWSQIDEKLLTQFKNWRKTTPIGKHNEKLKIVPCAEVINKQMQFLNKSFDLAVNKKLMSCNPIKFWPKENHQPKLTEALTQDELFNILSDERLERDYILNGVDKVKLPYNLRDPILLLFAACKRRKEILNLKISDLNFKERYAAYTEYKNSSKGTYNIQKAFYLTDEMIAFLKRVIGNRTSGHVFSCPEVFKRTVNDDNGDIGTLNGELLSKLFKELVNKHAPNKDVSLKCLRQTATSIMENAGLSDQQIDDTLGHYDTKTALKHYQDRSLSAINKRLAERTKPGITILSDTVKAFLV